MSFAGGDACVASDSRMMGWKQGGSLEFVSLVELGVLVAFECFTKKGCRLVEDHSTAS